MTVVATAGHVDHGKSALVRALTGTDPDRLPEERRRAMTIDVGYAYLRLPGGSWLDFIDVPGHEDYLGNMIVGAAEADAGLLVVAADEGIRPQTREHVQVLTALGVTPIIAAVTKADLLPRSGPMREERLAHLTAAIRALVDAAVPVVAVSALTGDGLNQLLTALGGMHEPGPATSAAQDPAFARMAIDRAFLIRGRGLVVTGTLRGQLAAGETVRLMPGGPLVRIRELQMHGKPIRHASGGRLAANLVGIDHHGVHRGMLLEHAGISQGTDRLLVALDAVELGALGRSSVRVHLGTGQAMARIRTLASTSGGRSVGVLFLDRSVAAAVGDRFVLRRPSPPAVLGGGRVIDTRVPHAGRASIDPADTEALVVGHGSSRHLPALVRLHGAVDRTRLSSRVVGRPIPPDLVDDRATAIAEVGQWYVSGELASRADEALRVAISDHATPAKGGLSVAHAAQLGAAIIRRDTSLSRTEGEQLGAALADRFIRRAGLRPVGRVVLPKEISKPPRATERAIEHAVALMDSRNPPSLQAVMEQSGCSRKLIDWLERSGRIRILSDKLVLSTQAYDEIDGVARRLALGGPVTPAALRDAAGTSRKFALAVLEDLDRRGVMQRSEKGHELVE